MNYPRTHHYPYVDEVFVCAKRVCLGCQSVFAQTVSPCWFLPVTGGVQMEQARR